MTQDNITFIIACIGCLGTIATWFSYIWNRRTSVSVKIHEYRYLGDKAITLYATITNNSGASISIGNIEITNDNRSIFVKKVPSIVCSHTKKTGNIVTYNKDTYNETFPINLYPYSGQSGYFQFDLMNHNPLLIDKYLNLEIYTNRKKKIRVEVELDKDCQIYKMS